LRADGLGTLIGGVFNTFPYTSFSQNVGLVGVTGVRSRWVTAAGGVIMLALGLIPKMAALVEPCRRPCSAAPDRHVRDGGGDRRAHPDNVDFKTTATTSSLWPSRSARHDPAGSAEFLQAVAARAASLAGIGILLAAIAAVVLNAFYNGSAQRRRRECRRRPGAQVAEHA